MLAQLAALISVLNVISLAQASPALLAPSSVPTIIGLPLQSDNGFCAKLLATCAASSQALSNPWSVEACLFGAACFSGQRPVDDFLSAVASAKGHAAVESANIPRVSTTIFDKISSDGKVITQQNFIDGLYSTLSLTNGPFPDASFAISDFQRLAIWTSFCRGEGIPYRNFADYFQFSASVSSNGCSGPVTTTVTIGSRTTQSPSGPVGTTTFPFTIIHSSQAPTTVLTRIVPPTPTPISSDQSCEKIFTTCVASVDPEVGDAWSHISCLLAAVCDSKQHPVDDLLSAVFFAKISGDPSGVPTSLKETRLSTATMKKISTNGKTVTLQNWIDAYYGQLAAVGGPYPINANGVIADFKRVQQWTAFCGSGGIPFKNLADYFEFSSTVSGPTSC